MKLHLFNPENDLALARDLTHYTAPPAASALACSGATLPLWYAEAGDAFAYSGNNMQWVNEMHDTFGMDIFPLDNYDPGLIPQPWGWSKAARTRFMTLGFPAESLPDDACLERLRTLSGRRSSCILGQKLSEAGLMPQEWCAEEISSVEAAHDYCRRHHDALFKLPWSSSGRGQIRINGNDDFCSRTQALAGALHRYGYVTAEPFHRDKVTDIALLFEAHSDGSVTISGLSLFATAPNGDYLGNYLASDEMITDMLEHRHRGIATQLRRTGPALAKALEELIDGAYTGPMGVDMMVLADGSPVGCVELNLRMTMGHVARRFHDRYCNPSSTGLFRMVPGRPGIPRAEIRGARLCDGGLCLSPPEAAMSFFAEIRPVDFHSTQLPSGRE